MLASGSLVVFSPEKKKKKIIDIALVWNGMICEFIAYKI